MDYKKNITYKQVLKYYYEKSKVATWRVPLVLFTRVVVLLSRVAEPWFIAQIINLIQADVTDMGKIRMYVWYIGITTTINFFWWRLIEHLIVASQINVLQAIAQEAFEYIHRHGSTFFSNRMSGSLLKKVKHGMDEFENLYDTFVFNLATPIWLTIWSVIVISSESRQLWIILAAWVIVYVYIQIVMYRIKWVKEDVTVSARSHRSGYLADTFSNHATIEHMWSIKSEQKTHRNKISDRTTKAKANRYYWNLIYAISWLLMNSLFLGGIVLIIYLRQEWAVQISLLILFFLYIDQLLEQLWWIGNVFKRVSTSLENWREYLELMFTPHEIQDESNAISANWEQPSITLDAISFWYQADTTTTVLDQFSLHIAPYEKIGLIWESGTGKSTLVKLLLRLYDIQQGSITIGDTNIRDYTIDSLRSSISYVPQEPILFHRSIRENILYGKPDATHKELVQATKRARAYKFIMDLPEWFESLVGERGVKLSWGQRQRVAIARAILHDADIIILDEATSALDSHTEHDIQDAMTEVMKWKTTIVIAHRLSTVKQLDRLIVLDQGKIIEEGTHTQLMEQWWLYAQTVQLQSGF